MPAANARPRRKTVSAKAVSEPRPSGSGPKQPNTNEIARLVKRCLQDGHSVEIERIGLFQPAPAGGIEFIPNNRPTIFLAYVEEDAAIIDELYTRLEDAGFDPWMDRRKLLPGQNWARAIEGAIATADFFVACLSTTSICKRGNFQREMRHALDCARSAPFDDVYFIPIRLDDCVVPTRIRQHLQYLDLFPDPHHGASQLISLIHRELRRRPSSSPASKSASSRPRPSSRPAPAPGTSRTPPSPPSRPSASPSPRRASGKPPMKQDSIS